MDDFGSVLVLALILWSVLGGLLGKARRGAPPQSRRPSGPRPESRQQPHAGRPAAPTEEATPRAGPVSAADMIPDELWELLTGEKRRREPVAAPRSPAEPSGAGGPPVPVPYELEYEPEAPEDEEWAPEAEPEALEPEPVVVPRRRESLEVDPVIVSLEQPLPPPAARHTAFHERMQALAPPTQVVRRRKRLPLNLGGMEDIRRMVVLREVLGPPKGLE